MKMKLIQMSMMVIKPKTEWFRFYLKTVVPTKYLFLLKYGAFMEEMVCTLSSDIAL